MDFKDAGEDQHARIQVAREDAFAVAGGTAAAIHFALLHLCISVLGWGSTPWCSRAWSFAGERTSS